MPRPFFSATAEDVLAVVEAVSVNPEPSDLDFVSNFGGLRAGSAGAALDLAIDLGLLVRDGTAFRIASPLCRLTRTPSVVPKAAVLRIALESYEPFLVFRERLVDAGSASVAADQTRVLLDLDAHRDEIRETLISLGGYAQALRSEGGGSHVPGDTPTEALLVAAAQAASNNVQAEMRVREQMGEDVLAVADRREVIVAMASALLKARDGDPRGAVVEAANATESYLTQWAGRVGVPIAGAHGINAKVDALGGAGVLPTKLAAVGKYLGHVRNAADHGTDADVGAAWVIREATGIEYVFVACSFLASARARELGKPATI